MGRIRNGFADHRYGKFIAMPMYVFTLSIVTVQSMCGFKSKLLGNPNSTHKFRLPCKGIDFSR